MTTVSFENASSTGGLEGALADIVMEEEIPTLTLADSIVHGYYNMGGLDDRVMWPATLPELEQLVPGSQKLMEFLLEYFARDATTGLVSGSLLCANYGNAGVNPYMLQPVLNSVHAAWASVDDLLKLDTKTSVMISMAAAQVEQMKARIDKASWPDCDRWFDEKTAEMRADVDKLARNAKAAMHDSITEILRLWVIVDLENILRKNRESMKAIQQDSESAKLPVVKGPGYIDI